MTDLSHPAFLTIGGIVAITVLNVAGAVLSRKLNFNFSNLAILSFAIYITVAYLVASEAGKAPALISTVAIGIYDAIIGWELSKKLNANFGRYKEMTENLSVHSRVFGTILFSLLLGFIGYWLA